MRIILAFSLLSLLVVGCQNLNTNENPVPESALELPDHPMPTVATKPHEFSHHGYTISDPWNWLKDPSYPNTDDEDVLQYLKDENAYYQAWLKSQESFKQKIFEEFKGRQDDTETSVPWEDNGYIYRWEYRPGEEYRTYYRKPISGGEEKIFMDQTALAEGHDYFVIRGWDISRDNKLLAYAVDTDGDERYQIFVVDLQSGEVLDEAIKDNSGALLFAKDNSLVYGELEKEKWRTRHIKRHLLGTDIADDAIIYTEEDDSFFVTFSLTSDAEYLVFGAGKGGVNEFHAVPSDDVLQASQLLASRDLNFEYRVDHAHGKFWIIANDQHVNFRIANAENTNPAYDNWKSLIEGSDSLYIETLQTFKDFMAVKALSNGLETLRLYQYDGSYTEIEFPETVFAGRFIYNYDFDQQHVRLNYESMITPDTVYDYQVASKTLDQKKQKQIPSGYDKSLYATERLMLPARDGVKVPVTLLYKKGIKKDGSNPLHLYAYGAYGITLPTSFSTLNFSLVDRGLVYAVAHIRGGAKMGYQWFLDGRLEKRQNTFNDFEDVARGLIKENYTSAKNISISGRSAGGKLMGVMAIQAPELWASINLGVPFVDVLNTILDDTLPLTPPEWDQWGNPITDKAAFELIRSYSPYDNITKREYPPMLVTGGLNDPRVTYWEPAKWTAKMRALKTDNNLLMMRMNMGAGHFANSGRYGRLLDYAEEYAFVLLSHGITE